MNRSSRALFTLAVLVVSAGAGWVYPPAGVITLGVLLGVAGWLLLDAKDAE